eukprot:6277518-Prymnesium_polylepis.1
MWWRGTAPCRRSVTACACARVKHHVISCCLNSRPALSHLAHLTLTVTPDHTRDTRTEPRSSARRAGAVTLRRNQCNQSTDIPDFDRMRFTNLLTNYRTACNLSDTGNIALVTSAHIRPTSVLRALAIA